MLYTLLFLILTYLILTQPAISLHYAFHGFTLWYSKMIPSLLPFMILSGMLVRMNLTDHFSKVLHPLLKRLFRCNGHLSFGIIMGFLCGFPMGAKVTADLLHHHKISKREAEFLLAFCNNIGPVYFCTFVIPLLGITTPAPYLFGMYGLPFLYGIVIRRTLFRDLDPVNSKFLDKSMKPTSPLPLFTALDEAIHTSIQSILMLCGYMILFNLLNILPHFFFPKLHHYLAPLLEITGGLSMLGQTLPLYSLCLLPFGGFSCIAQTHSIIAETGLSIRKYILHKVLLTILTIAYYGILTLIP